MAAPALGLWGLLSLCAIPGETWVLTIGLALG